MTRQEEAGYRRGFAARVRRLMEVRGLTVAGLADRAKLDRPTVEAILAARHPVWLDEVFLLAGALGVEPGELVGRGHRRRPKVMRDKREALERLGRNLRGARLRVGLTQRELAGRVGISRSYLSELEAGAYECRCLTAMRLAGGLGIRIEELLDGIAWIPDPDRTDPGGSGG